MPLSFRRLSLLGLLALLVAFVPMARPADAAGPYVVTKTADTNDGACDGDCSLREAIVAANASPGAISFGIPAGDPGHQPAGYWRIAVDPSLGALPALTGGGITIDGGAVDGTPSIELSGGGVVSGQGLLIRSSNNTVRGLIVNGFVGTTNGHGIRISAQAAPADHNRIERCYIGTNYNGTAAGGPADTNNNVAGIAIQFGASDNVIDNNVISGNGGSGVLVYTLFSSGTTVQQRNVISNNRIGVTAAGTAALGNREDGVYIGDNSNDNVVGPGNIISANGPAGSTTVYGVNIGGRLLVGTDYISGNRVIGNRIGTDGSGGVALPNAAGGVLLSGGVRNSAIGGPGDGDGNLISGNHRSGVDIRNETGSSAATAGIVVRNNRIGVDASGTAALPNDEAGVEVWKGATGVTIGPGNLIGGNKLHGVWLLTLPDTVDGDETHGISVTGNAIGLDTAGTTAIPNQKVGVLLEGDTYGNTIAANQIGGNKQAGISLTGDAGATPAAPASNIISGNTISANGPIGIELVAGSGTNTIGLSGAGAGNTISGHSQAGIWIDASSGNFVKANAITANQVGISINSGAKNNLIGGDTVIEGNTLIGNTSHGVLVTDPGTTGNTISRTTTRDNGGKGIALAAGGNLGNQAGRPGLASLAVSGSTLSGTVTNAAGCGAGGCTVQVFTDDSPPVDEGPTFLTSFASAGSFSGISVAGCKPYLIFTVTDSAGNTSEFTGQLGPFDQCVPLAPAVTLGAGTPSPQQSAFPGASATYTHRVTNTGTAPGALAVTRSSNGWTTTLDTSACPTSLDPGQFCDVTLAVAVPAGAQAGDQNQTTVTAQLAGAAASDQKIDTTTAIVSYDFSLEPATQTQSTGPSQPVDFAHILTNLGSGSGAFSVTVSLPPEMAGWGYSVEPAGLIILAKSASAPFTVTYTLPPGIASGSTYTATVEAFATGAPSAPKQAEDVVQVTSGAVPQISSVVTPPVAAPGDPVTIEYTIANTGDVSGTFDLSFTPPPGWLVTAPVSPSVQLEPGATAAVSATIEVPAGAPAGQYPVTLIAVAGAAPFAQASKTDMVQVAQQGGLSLDPDIDDPLARAPGAVITYTSQLVTNSGNFTDTIGLQASSSRGWGARALPAGLELGPGESQAISVELSIPIGQPAGLQNTTYVTATSSLPAIYDSALITTTVAEVAGALIDPHLQTRSLDAGEVVTFTFTLTNSGSVAQSYGLAATSAPLGWSSDLAPQSAGPLLPGESTPVTLTLGAPADAPNGASASVTITASCSDQVCDDASATAIARVGPPGGVTIGGSCDTTALPGDQVTCVHTISNSGFTADTFAVELLSSLGWSTTLSQASLPLAPGDSQAVTITIAVPTTAPAGALHKLRVRVSAASSPGLAPEVIDTIAVLQYAGVHFWPSWTRPLVPGASVELAHRLTNTGNGADDFTIEATQSLGWAISIAPSATIHLVAGASAPVTVTVQVPLDAPPAATNRVSVRATSVLSPTVYDDLIDIIGGPGGLPTPQQYLPLVRR